jgi:MGT family glycosyltransferase
VRVMTQRSLRGRVETLGLTHVAFDAAPDVDVLESPPWRAGVPFAAMRWWRDDLVFGPAARFAKDVRTELGRRRADCVAVDMMLPGAALGARVCGAPVASLIHLVYPRPAPGLPAAGFGFRPANGPLSRWRDRVINGATEAFLARGLGPLNQAAIHLGQPPLVSSWAMNDRVDRVLVMVSRHFDFPATALPPNVTYVGPVLEPAAPQMWENPWPSTDTRPLVLVSLSTINAGQFPLLGRIVRALGRLPVRALVTLGGLKPPTRFNIPPNVRVAPFVAHEQVLPMASAVVCHAGHGTVSKALKAGLPLLCIPFESDQFDNAARVVWHGAGLRRSRFAREAQIATAVRRLLEDARYRSRAQHLRSLMTEEDEANLAVLELETLATGTYTADR